MRIKMNPEKPVHIRVKYNGTHVFDQVLEPGPHDIDVEHPKCCGIAQLFFVKEDGSETPAGSANYGACDCDKAQTAA